MGRDKMKIGLLIFLILLPAGVWATSPDTLRPSGVGDSTIFTPSAGANWECVDEPVSDGDGSYVSTIGNLLVWRTDLYAIPDGNGSGAIDSVVVYSRAKSTGALTSWRINFRTALKSGDSLKVSANKQPGTDYILDSLRYTTDPNTGSAWTWAAIANMQAGVAMVERTADKPGYATQVWAQVYYQPAPPVCNPVVGVDTISVDTTTAALVWAQSESSFCTGYVVRAKVGQDFYPISYSDGWLVGETNAIADTTVTITDLLPNTWQSLTVFAKDTSGGYSDTAGGDSSSITIRTDAFGGFNYFRHLNVIYAGSDTLIDYPVRATFESGFVGAEYLATWSNLMGPAAIYNSDTNRTYIAYLAEDESINVFYYGHNTHELSNSYAVGDVPAVAETHGSPSMIIDTLGYIHIFYGCHSSQLKHSVSSVPYEIDQGWDSVSTPFWHVTYPAPVLYPDGSLGLFLRSVRRQNEGAGYFQNMIYWRSVDNGYTWSGSTSTWTTQPTNGKDAYINHADSFHCFGSVGYLQVDSTSISVFPRNRILLSFSLTSFPYDSSSHICGAGTVYAYCYAEDSTINETVRMYKVNKAWQEDGVTWDSADAGVTAWTTKGCDAVPADREGTAMSQAIIDTTGKWFTWVVAESTLKDWVNDSTSNKGLIFISTSNYDGYNAKWFYSSDTTASEKPKLVIPVQPHDDIVVLPDSGGNGLGIIYRGVPTMDDSGNVHLGLWFCNTVSSPNNNANLYYLECLRDGSTFVNSVGDTYSLPLNLTNIEMAMRTDTNVTYVGNTQEIGAYNNRPAILSIWLNRDDTSRGTCWMTIKHDTGWANYPICHMDNERDSYRLFFTDSLHLQVYVTAVHDNYYAQCGTLTNVNRGGYLDLYESSDGGETWAWTSRLTDYPIQILQIKKVLHYDTSVADYIKLMWNVGLVKPATIEVWPPQWEYGYYDFNYDMIGSNGEDVRFFSSDLSDSFPYFLERWEPWGKSDFWFKMDSIMPGTTKVLVGMGDASLSSESYGDSVFDFFEDFSDLSDWKTIYGSANVDTVCFIDGRDIPAFSEQGKQNLIRKALPYDSMTIRDWMFVNYEGSQDDWGTYIRHGAVDTIGWHYARWPLAVGLKSWNVAWWNGSAYNTQAFGMAPPFTNTCGWIPWEFNSKTGKLKFQDDSVYTIAVGIETDSITIGDRTAADSSREAYATCLMGRRAVSIEPTTYWGEAMQFYEFWDKKTSDFAFGDTTKVAITGDKVQMALTSSRGIYVSRVFHIYSTAEYGYKTWSLQSRGLNIPGFLSYYVRSSDEAFTKTAESPSWVTITPGAEISPNLIGAYIQYKAVIDNFATSDRATDLQMGLGKIIWDGQESRIQLCTDKSGVDDVGILYRKYKK